MYVFSGIGNFMQINRIFHVLRNSKNNGPEYKQSYVLGRFSSSFFVFKRVEFLSRGSE